MHEWMRMMGIKQFLLTEFLRRNRFIYVKVLHILEGIVLKNTMKTAS